MQAEIIAIGDELTSGQRLDTNSQWLSQQLGDLGVAVDYHTTVGDELARHVDVLRVAAQRTDIVVMTGGLGPTADDLTRDAFAALLAVPLKLDEPSLRHIEQLFMQRRGRPMPQSNVVQAMLPEGAVPIPNPHGTAPGIEVHWQLDPDRLVHFFALPGVPAEMKEMWEQTVAPRISLLLGTPRLIRHHCLKCFGVGESDLEQMLPGMIRRDHVPRVGITVSQATISLRITAEGGDEQQCLTQIDRTVATIHQCLGDLVFGTGDDELQHAVLRMLASSRLRLAVAECGTSGLLTQWLSEASSPAPDIFLGGWTFAGRDAWTRTAWGRGAERDNDEQLCRAMADEVRQQLGADVGLALGPWPAMTSASEQDAKVAMAIAGSAGSKCRSAAVVGHPDLLQARAAKQALNLLRLALLHGAAAPDAT